MAQGRAEGCVVTPQQTPAQRELRVGTAKDVARLIGASLNTVYALAAAGDIPTLRKIGPRLRFDLDAIEAWMREEQS